MKQKETQQETMSKEKRVVFFFVLSWYHRTKELQDDLTTKYGKKGGFETQISNFFSKSISAKEPSYNFESILFVSEFFVEKN